MTLISPDDPRVKGWDAVAFDDVAEGDTLRFLTRETGYGGRGIYERTGRVTAVTAKTVRVWCDDDTPRGTVAVLRRADWGSRSVRRYTKPARGHLDSLKNRKRADPGHVAEILAKRCQECQGAGCPQCGYKPHRDADAIEPPKPADTPTTYTYTAQTYRDTGYVEREFTVEGPLYHGGGRRLREGAQLTAGRRTNPWGDEGPKSRYVHFTTRLDVAAAYARQSGGHVYIVEPTGPFAIGYSGDEYKSEHPLNVVRRLAPAEWQ